MDVNFMEVLYDLVGYCSHEMAIMANFFYSTMGQGEEVGVLGNITLGILIRREI